MITKAEKAKLDEYTAIIDRLSYSDGLEIKTITYELKEKKPKEKTTTKKKKA